MVKGWLLRVKGKHGFALKNEAIKDGDNIPKHPFSINLTFSNLYQKKIYMSWIPNVQFYKVPNNLHRCIYIEWCDLGFFM